MPTLNNLNSFLSYDFTPEDEISALNFSDLQIMYFQSMITDWQNLLRQLEYNPADPQRLGLETIRLKSRIDFMQGLLVRRDELIQAKITELQNNQQD